MDKNRSPFETGDIALLEAVLHQNPILHATAALVKAARGLVKFPLTSIADLKPIFAGRAKMVLGTRIFTFDDFEKHTPKEFFPIETETELIERAVIAFAIGEMAHQHDVKPMPKGGYGEYLPSPGQNAFHPLAQIGNGR